MVAIPKTTWVDRMRENLRSSAEIRRSTRSSESPRSGTECTTAWLIAQQSVRPITERVRARNVRFMSDSNEAPAHGNKVPPVTVAFWVIKNRRHDPGRPPVTRCR